MNGIVRIALGITACVGVGACSSVSESETGSDMGGAGAGNPLSMGHASAPDALPTGASGAPDGDTSSAGAPYTGPTAVYAGTTELDVPVPDTGRVYVKLEGPAVVDPKTPADSSDWDLAFEGFNVYTNSGPSGTAQGSAFGPLDIVTLEDEATPTVPFLSPDKTGGAFADWYAYDGTSHALYSRFHVYGVKSGGALWKAQVLSYYSAQDNAPVSALYQFRYAQLGDPVGTTRTIQVDGTADGLGGAADSPSGCLDLATGTISKLTTAAASTSKTWDLCFRRDSISVNGEVGGPRGVVAADLQGSETSGEGLATVKQETTEGALPAFDAVTAASLSGVVLRGDHVVSAFETGGWLDSKAFPATPTKSSWLVMAADGTSQFLVAFSEFRNITTSSPGAVVMHVKPVKQ